MEIPFDYILISIMINLKNRKVKAEVSKQSLIKIINKIIYNLNVLFSMIMYLSKI